MDQIFVVFKDVVGVVVLFLLLVVVAVVFVFCCWFIDCSGGACVWCRFVAGATSFYSILFHINMIVCTNCCSILNVYHHKYSLFFEIVESMYLLSRQRVETT